MATSSVLFPREPADTDNGRVGERSCLFQQLLRQRRLHGHPRLPALSVLLLYVLSVVICKFLKHLHMTGLFLQSLVKIAGVCHRHIAASPASLHIVKGRLAEQRHPASLCQRQHIVLILQKHHAFLCRVLGKRYVFAASRDAPSAFPQG